MRTMRCLSTTLLFTTFGLFTVGCTKSGHNNELVDFEERDKNRHAFRDDLAQRESPAQSRKGADALYDPSTNLYLTAQYILDNNKRQCWDVGRRRGGPGGPNEGLWARFDTNANLLLTIEFMGGQKNGVVVSWKPLGQGRLPKGMLWVQTIPPYQPDGVLEMQNNLIHGCCWTFPKAVKIPGIQQELEFGDGSFYWSFGRPDFSAGEITVYDKNRLTHKAEQCLEEARVLFQTAKQAGLFK